MITKFKIFEAINDYAVGDVVMIKYSVDSYIQDKGKKGKTKGHKAYWQLKSGQGNLISVKIVSINGDEILVQGPNVDPFVIKKSQIIQREAGLEVPVENNYKTMNPTIRIPNETGASGHPYKSNDLNMQ